MVGSPWDLAGGVDPAPVPSLQPRDLFIFICSQGTGEGWIRSQRGPALLFPVATGEGALGGQSPGPTQPVPSAPSAAATFTSDFLLCPPQATFRDQVRACLSSKCTGGEPAALLHERVCLACPSLWQSQKTVLGLSRGLDLLLPLWAWPLRSSVSICGWGRIPESLQGELLALKSPLIFWFKLLSRLRHRQIQVTAGALCS